MGAARPPNHFAYIPAQCYAQVKADTGARNPCYTCHRNALAPNYTDDAALQVEYQIPTPAAENPWKNTIDPPIARAAPVSDAALLAYVRDSNYFDAAGKIAVRAYLDPLTPGWDGAGDKRWNGFIPDARFHFDDEGFDQNEDGSDDGWRAFAYRPFPGAFMPTNGSMGDVLIRLDPRLRTDSHGRYSRAVYRLNLAIVEALIARRDVPIAATDERALGVDLDLDGELGTATQVTFDRRADPNTGKTRMSYVGAGHDATDDLLFPIAVGLFPLNTEFLHSVRYLDPESGTVHLAARMKELRYAKKVNFFSYADLKTHAMNEATEQAESADGSREPVWQFDRGMTNGQGWLYQGFIEAADGRLRPQSFAETAACTGCHGGVGASADSAFSFPRKLAATAFRGGWFHWSQGSLAGVPELRTEHGGYEYTDYVQQAGGDDFGENGEVRERFFTAHNELNRAAVDRLHQDVSALLVPSPARALALDRAYLAIVREQSFVLGRDALLGASEHVLHRVPAGKKTGISSALGPTAAGLARGARADALKPAQNPPI